MCNQFALHHEFRIDAWRTNFGQKMDSILCVCVDTTPHMSHFLTDSHAHECLKSCVCRARITCHDSSSCVHVFVLTLFDYFTFLSLSTIFSYHLVLPPAHQLHFPQCVGQIPCALQQMRTLAPLPSITISQSLDLVNKEHKDPNDIDMEAPRLA